MFLVNILKTCYCFSELCVLFFLFLFCLSGYELFHASDIGKSVFGLKKRRRVLFTPSDCERKMSNWNSWRVKSSFCLPTSGLCFFLLSSRNYRHRSVIYINIWRLLIVAISTWAFGYEKDTRYQIKWGIHPSHSCNEMPLYLCFYARKCLIKMTPFLFLVIYSHLLTRTLSLYLLLMGILKALEAGIVCS